MNMTEENIILLADDNSDDIKLTRRLFKRNRIRNKLMVIQDGDEVLEYVFRQGAYKSHTYQLPSLILIDLKLPKIEGVEVLKKIRSDPRTSSIPVLVLISHESEKNLIKEHHISVEGFIQKPLNIKKLKKAVDVIDFSLILDEKEGL